MNTTVTTAALADLLGISTRSIRDLKKRGIIVAAGKDFALADSVRGYCDTCASCDRARRRERDLDGDGPARPAGQGAGRSCRR